MHIARSRRIVLIALLTLTLPGCAGSSVSGRGSSSSQSRVAGVTAGPGTSNRNGSPTSPKPGNSASQPTSSDTTTDFFLAQQISLIAGGDGAVPHCSKDLSVLPAEFQSAPAVWISSIYGPSSVLVANDKSALCLNGFDQRKPITVTVSAGSKQYTTDVVPAAGTFTSLLRPETLFTGTELSAYGIGNGVLQSAPWQFVPPDDARERVAAAGQLRISAVQGTLTASFTQPITLPSRRDREWLRGDDTFRRIVIYGFDPGTRLPVGLYFMDQPYQHAILIGRIGIVTVPASRTVVFTVPDQILNEDGGGKYCITVPLDTQDNCPSPL